MFAYGAVIELEGNFNNWSMAEFVKLDEEDIERLINAFARNDGEDVFDFFNHLHDSEATPMTLEVWSALYNHLQWGGEIDMDFYIADNGRMFGFSENEFGAKWQFAKALENNPR